MAEFASKGLANGVGIPALVLGSLSAFLALPTTATAESSAAFLAAETAIRFLR